MNESYIRKHEPEVYDHILNNYPTDIPFMERLWLYRNNRKTKPVCKNCGGEVKFYNITRGYQTYCSIKCSNSDPDKVESTKETCINKYGGVAPACSSEVVTKMKTTTYERHGEDAFIRNKKSMDESTKQKMKDTCMERYGVDNAMKYSDFKSKCNKNKDYKSIADKIKETWRIKRLQSPDILEVFDDINEFRVKCPHIECSLCQEKWFDIKIGVYHDRKYNHIELCTRILPIKPAGITNTYPEIFIKNILNEYDIPFESNNRDVLGGKEIDIYIPDRNIAIECNGVYWHSLKDKAYHYDKWKACKDKDIQLLTIWEDQIVNKPEIIRSILLSKMGIYKERIHARKCIIKEVCPNDAGRFLHENHIQGKCRSLIWLGLYHMDKLVCLMGFDKSKSRVGIGSVDDNTWELTRFCTLRNIQVIGGASKLFNHFIKNHANCMVKSFSSHDISMGELYQNLGFIESGKQLYSYWYIEHKTLKRYHRYSFTKKSLISKGYDPNLTESEIMSSLPYYKIYDSGQTKWLYKI